MIAMKHKEKCQAAEALIDWFVSQQINEADAADVMTIVLAGIILDNEEGAEILKQQVLSIAQEVRR